MQDVRNHYALNVTSHTTVTNTDVRAQIVDPNAVILAKASALLQNAGEIDLIWRGISYDTYLFQKLTNWKPTLSPPPNDPFERAHPH